MLKILITGGTGFIGHNLIEQLDNKRDRNNCDKNNCDRNNCDKNNCDKNKYEIYSPTSSELNLLEDEKTFNYIKGHKFDVVIHTSTWDATINSKKNISNVLENNLRMFFNIARCNNYYGKMLYYGSGAEFDREHWIPKMKEDYFDKHVPKDQYGFSKYVMCKYISCVKNIYNLRLFGVFGKYEDYRIRFISNVCYNVINNLPIVIDRNVFFDYMYINDLVNITEWFINNNCDEKVYNVCAGSTYSLESLAKKIMNLSNTKINIDIRVSELGNEYSGDNTKLLNEIGNYKFMLIDESIKDLYNWYLLNKNNIEIHK